MASEIEYQLKCEIKCCEICGDWIDWTNKLIVIKRKHYHQNCIVDLYLKLQPLNHLVYHGSLCKSLPVQFQIP